MKDFHDLLVWQKAHRLTLSIYRATQSFPADERFGLTSQMRRSSSSVAANIAEGCGRGSDADFGRFLQLAMGSASETEYHIELARDLNYLSDDQSKDLTAQVQETKRMLSSFLKKLKADR